MTKETLILIPGLLCDAAVWEDVKHTLDSSHEIIIPDLNHTDTPEAMVAAVMANAPAKFALAGHSMGGWVALEVMRQHADRVNALCLANTSARLDSTDKAAAREKLIKLAEEQDYRTLLDALLNVFIYQKSAAPAVRAMLERNQAALIPQEHAMQRRADCVPLLPGTRCRTQVIHSDQDAVFDISHSQELVENIPDAALTVISDSGHMSPMEKAGEFTAIIKKWLML